ncbi:IS3 family transposase [Dyella terrae]|nr:IS3 family transposase [Dyella terrae]
MILPLFHEHPNIRECTEQRLPNDNPNIFHDSLGELMPTGFRHRNEPKASRST